MRPGGTLLWTVLLWAGPLVLAVGLARAFRIRAFAAGGALLILIAVVGVSTAGIGGSSLKPPWITVPLPGDQTIWLRAIDFAFRPSIIAAAPGVPLTLELVNSGAVVHTVVIPVLGVRATLLPGEHRAVRVGRVEAGTYEFFCAIPAHRQAGMIGRLVVGPEN